MITTNVSLLFLHIDTLPGDACLCKSYWTELIYSCSDGTTTTSADGLMTLTMTITIKGWRLERETEKIGEYFQVLKLERETEKTDEYFQVLKLVSISWLTYNCMSYDMHIKVLGGMGGDVRGNH